MSVSCQNLVGPGRRRSSMLWTGASWAGEHHGSHTLAASTDGAPGVWVRDRHQGLERLFVSGTLAFDVLRVVNSLTGIFLHCWRKHDVQEDWDRGRFGTGTRRHSGGPDPAQGRHHPYDGALWLEFHQHGHSYDTARPGRDRRQRPASLALHLGVR